MYVERFYLKGHTYFIHIKTSTIRSFHLFVYRQCTLQTNNPLVANECFIKWMNKTKECRHFHYHQFEPSRPNVIKRWLNNIFLMPSYVCNYLDSYVEK